MKKISRLLQIKKWTFLIHRIPFRDIIFASYELMKMFPLFWKIFNIN